MSCDCRKGAVAPGCSRHSVADRVSTPAFYEERIRLLRYAFADCLLALSELGHEEVAERLRERWPEAKL